MNSTGSGKSSTVSSVSELLDLYEEDPEEILYNLGFGQEEPDLSSKVPSRFFNNVSSARGIDIKVYLGAQLQRMELENPNYALTNRFRQIEVLTSVANEFFQLYSQVSGQMIQPVISRDKEAEGGAEEACPPLKRSSSALNTAKLLKKSITKLNLLGGSAESPEAGPPSTNHIQPHNGHAHSEHVPAKCHIEHNNGSTKPDHQGETANQKNIRKKDSCSLSTVAEETNGDGETDRPTDDRPEAATGVPQPASTDLHSANQMADERVLVNREEEEEEEENMSSTPGKAPPTLAPPQITQLRSENADSFDMDEVQSNEDEPPARSSRNTGEFNSDL
ncbi:hypothetical protein LDENG_00262840 [Lucifuga dentata]|nr:hypothetical protein LDENG_00262840 [Lucifuga dentata]